MSDRPSPQKVNRQVRFPENRGAGLALGRDGHFDRPSERDPIIINISVFTTLPLTSNAAAEMHVRDHPGPAHVFVGNVSLE
jgi:hypothetical protein